MLQVRQHTGHKRTFFYLEQLILKFSADQQCINIKEMHEVGKHPQTDIPGWASSDSVLQTASAPLDYDLMYMSTRIRSGMQEME